MKTTYAILFALVIIACKKGAPGTPPAAEPNCGKGMACYVTSSNGLNMRSAPIASSRIITVLPYGQFVKIEEVSPEQVTVGQFKGRFVKLTYQNKSGWVLDSLLSPEKPISNDYEVATQKIQQELKEIESIALPETKLSRIKALRKKIADSEHNVGLRFLDYDACMLALKLQSCQNQSEELYSGTEKEFISAIQKAVAEKNSPFLKRYSSCALEVGCYFCDVFINTSRDNALNHLSNLKAPIDFTKVRTDPGTDRDENPSNVYIYSDPKNPTDIRAYFVLKVAQKNKRWQLRMVGGDVMRGVPEPTCGVGG